jgi:hypothetical protein
METLPFDLLLEYVYIHHTKIIYCERQSAQSVHNFYPCLTFVKAYEQSKETMAIQTKHPHRK